EAGCVTCGDREANAPIPTVFVIPRALPLVGRVGGTLCSLSPQVAGKISARFLSPLVLSGEWFAFFVLLSASGRGFSRLIWLKSRAITGSRAITRLCTIMIP